MLTLEAIAVLGFLYLFFMYGMVRAQLAMNRRSKRIQEPSFVPTESTPEATGSAG